MSETSTNGIASERLARLFDGGSFTELDAGSSGGARAGYGSVGGATAFAFCQDSSVDGGAFDEAQARKLMKVYELAARTGSPVVTVYDSKGVQLEDGFAALKASSEMLRRVSELSGVVPQLAVVVGPCGGGAAMAAAMADFCIMSKTGELFLTSAFDDKAAGGRVKEVGSAAFAQKAGVAAIVCETEEDALAQAADLLRLLPLNNLAALPVSEEGAAPAFKREECPIKTSCDAGSFIELFPELGDTARAALCTIGGMPVGAAGVRGALDGDGAAKLARLFEVCDSFNLPIVTFVDSGGLEKSAQGDVCGGIRASARLAHVLAEATSPKITVITGSAVGAAYSVFCGANAGCDMAFAWEGAVISPLSPAAAVSLLWENRIQKSADIETLAAEYAAGPAGAVSAAAAGMIDAVIAPEDTRERLIAALDMLASKRVSRMPKKHGNMPC